MSPVMNPPTESAGGVNITRLHVDHPETWTSVGIHGQPWTSSMVLNCHYMMTSLPTEAAGAVNMTRLHVDHPRSHGVGLSFYDNLPQEMDNSGSARPNPELLRRCGYIFGAEILIDITKHAVLSKLNDIRPTVYQRFMRVR